MPRNISGDRKSERGCGTIAIADSSALYYWMHRDVRGNEDVAPAGNVLLGGYAQTTSELKSFNVDHPYFGGRPVSVLVPDRSLRAHSKSIVGRLCLSPLPEGSFVELRKGLYVTSPPLTYVRMANTCNEIELAEIGTNLCGQYYLNAGDGQIFRRQALLTAPEVLTRYAREATELRGSSKALKALSWILPFSGSPMESKMQLLFRLPMGRGGFALPFTDMNYAVSDRRSKKICEQGWYSIDLAAPRYKVGLEYDGIAYHQSTSRDNRRRNALRSLGWDVFPTDRAVIFDAGATERLAYQIAKRMKLRVQKPKGWESKYVELRSKLNLPN